MANGKASNDPDQHDRVFKTARQLGFDEDKAEFDKRLKAMAGPKRESDLHLRRPRQQADER